MVELLIFLFLGLFFGILTGFLGIGGGFLMTPALNILGFGMVYAIGTSFSTIAGKTLIGVIRHYGLGNVDLRLGMILGLISILGVDLGKRLVFYLEELNLADTSIRLAYIFLLLLISILMLKEYFLSLKKTDEKKGTEGKKYLLASQISRIRIPPMISLPNSGVEAISIWVIVFLGILIGFLSGFMGIGGGFVSFPILIYMIGTPTLVAVGTSLINVFLTSCYGTIVYALAGKVEWISVLIILAGSFIGVPVGVSATRYVSAMKIRLLFALFLFSIAISIFLKQINWVTLSTYLMACSAFLISLAILLPLMKRRRGQELPKANLPS